MFNISSFIKANCSIEKTKEIIFNKEIINSFLIAILIMSGLISFITGINNIIPILIVTVLILIEIINLNDTIERLKNGKIRVQDSFLIFFIATIIIFIISILNNGLRATIMDRLAYFAGFIVLPFLCLRHNVKVSYIINSVLIISGIIAIPLFFEKFGNFSGGNRMAISYYMLPTYIAMIMIFFVSNNKSIKSNILKIVTFLTLYYPYLLFLVKYISRGVIIAIILCLVFCILIKKEKNKRIITILILALILIIGALSFKPIIIFTNNALENCNIKVEFISKNAKLLNDGKVDNGRNKVYNQTIEGIKENTLIGNGIGDYAEKYITYPHNILLQAWYEGGVVYFLIHLFIFLYSFYVLLFDENTSIEKKQLLLMLISIALVRLMLSYEFWKEISYGLYLYVIFDIMKENVVRRKLKYGNNNNSNIQ